MGALLLLYVAVIGMLGSFVGGTIISPGISLEVNALITMKQYLADPGSNLASWDRLAVDACGFFHVTCSNQLSVIRIDLSGARLSGTLSPAIGSLPNLQHLVMPYNSLSGTLPPELGNLTGLVELDLSNNKFNGTIPSTIGQLQSLVYLRLNNNNLSGALSFFSNMTNLQVLDLSSNNFNGTGPRISSANFNFSNNPACLLGPTQGCPTIIEEQPLTQAEGSSSLGVGMAKSGRPSIWFLACGLISAGLLLAILMLAALSWMRRQTKQAFFDVHAQGPDASLGQLKKFSLRELQIATDNFDNKNVLGKGGFGHVYKGSLSDGSSIAVKRLKDGNIAGGELQFQMEVEMISLAVHRNLLRLVGFCMTPTERLLVYPYMCNGSVASRLHDTVLGKPVLDWPARKRIALGAARGLLYLHEHCDPKIIHRDVKAANILLDDTFEAVVGDFGLAKLLDHQDTHITTAVRGTVGHIAPEYLSTGQSSEKTDVFGYGILLLELITGERAFDFGRIKQRKDVMLLDWVKTLHHDKKLECLADARLKADFNAFQLEEMVQVALLCTQFSPADRPSMAVVVRMLEGDGLAERWEEWQKVELRRTQQARLLPRRFDRMVEDSTFDLEAVELSGPR